MADGKAIRVFVSSTFRDMQAERDELVKRVFPLLRRRCEERGVAWSEVDLRWGVTDEQAAEGAVLPICLAEIDRTRPYFIGLLGQRYGWVPDTLPPDLAEQLGWLTDETGKSVTELEILHGVLNNPEAAGHAYFYLRDPAWVAALPPDEREPFVEPTPEGAERLAELRRRVAESGFPTADYESPEALGDRVLADFEELIDRLYPPDAPDDPAGRADAVHAAFGQARFGLHVPRTAAAVPELDGSPLLVTGAPGVGASSLVTAWTETWRAARPGAPVVVHHCDADAEAGEFRHLAARVVAGLSGEPLGAVAERLAAAPPAAVGAALVAAAATAGPALVVIDGVDHLAEGSEPGDRAPDLRWLPAGLAGAGPVDWVLTGSGSRAREAFAHRGWPMYEVPALSADERRTITRAVLAAGAKQLDADHLEALVAAPATGNVRFLRIVLDELRQHGDHFTLRALIDRLTAAADVDELLDLVLARYEADFEGARPGLVGDAMTAVWAARDGLAEAELLDLLTPGPDHLPQRVWAPLHLAAEHGLVSRGGLLGFAHPGLRAAVERRYLADDESRRAAHAEVAAYFAERRAAEGVTPRVADELAWQYAEAGDDAALASTLTDGEWFDVAYARHPGDPRRLWTRLEPDPARRAGRMRVAYADVTASADGQLAWGAAQLLSGVGAVDAAYQLQLGLADAARSVGGKRLLGALLNLGVTQLGRGDRETAAATFGECAERARAEGDTAIEAAAVGNLAVATDNLALFAEADRLYRDVGDLYDVQANLSGWAETLRGTGDFTGALALLEQQEQLCRELADPIGVGRALAGQAVVLTDLGRPGEAIPRLDEYAEIAAAEGDLRGVAEARLNAASARFQSGDVGGGTAAADAAEAIARQLGDPAVLARVLVARATGLCGVADWAGAELAAREAELTARQAGLPELVALALGFVGTARREQGDLAGSLDAHTAEHLAATESGDPTQIAIAEANLGNVDAAAHRFDAALRHYDAAADTLRASGTAGALLPVLANRAQIHQMHQRWPEALADYTDAAELAAGADNLGAAGQWAEPGIQIAYQLGDTARAERLWAVLEQVARAGGDQAALQRALGERALMLISRQAYDDAAALLDEQEQVSRQIGDPVGLAQCVGNRAIVRRYTDDLAGALAALDEQLAIASASGNAQGVLFATANRGEVLGLLGRLPEAIQTLQSARQTAAQYGLHPMAQQIDQMIAALQQRN